MSTQPDTEIKFSEMKSSGSDSTTSSQLPRRREEFKAPPDPFTTDMARSLRKRPDAVDKDGVEPEQVTSFGELYNVMGSHEVVRKEPEWEDIFKVTELPPSAEAILRYLEDMKMIEINIVIPINKAVPMIIKHLAKGVDDLTLKATSMYVKQEMMTEKERLASKNKGEGEGEGGKVGDDDNVIRLEDGLWYSPSHLPQLSDKLFSLVKQLEVTGGDKFALATLNIVLLEELFNIKSGMII